jgi:DNA primase
MQKQDVTAQKSVDIRLAAGRSRVQRESKLTTSHRIDFKAIKRAAHFERVLAYYGVELRSGRGAQWKALCPFHRDTRPSLNVNLDMKVFNCFVCGDGGDIVKFVAKQEYPTSPGRHLIQAVEKLAEICRISMDRDRREVPAKRGERLATEESQNGSSSVPNPPLSFRLDVDPTHPYLIERGLSPDIVETFGLGYCMSEQSMMRRRIVIPIHNEHGELVAYAGRWPGDNGWPEGTDKYMLPRNFQKMRVLFNLNRVIQGMLELRWPNHEHHVIVVEGFFGAFAIHWLAPCVALMGSVLSKEHLNLMARANIRFVTLILDGPSKNFTRDQHGIWGNRITATVRQLGTNGFFVRARELGPREQPDTISRERLEGLVSL